MLRKEVLREWKRLKQEIIRDSLRFFIRREGISNNNVLIVTCWNNEKIEGLEEKIFQLSSSIRIFYNFGIEIVD